MVTVEAVGQRTRVHYTTSVTAADWQALQSADHAYTFDAPAQPFRLALEAERLRLAYTANPLLAANNARVDLLPHQMEAVYGVMLPQPRICYLPAHDAGAGKTAMCGLLYKELAGPQPEMRTLIVAPAALTRQWQRDQRDSYVDLYSHEPLPQNAPVIGERWLVMRPAAYREIAKRPERVTAEEIVSAVAVQMVQSGGPAVSVPEIYRQIKEKHRFGIEDESFVAEVQQVVREHGFGFRMDGETMTEIAAGDPAELAGEFFKDTTVKPPVTESGRSIVIHGSIDLAKVELTRLFQKIVQPLSSQRPASPTMQLTITAQFDTDLGSDLDATLDDAFNNNAFPRLTREDSKKVKAD